MNPLLPWAWSAADGARRLSSDLEREGYTLFEDPQALARCGDPVTYAEHLFGRRPIRYQRMLVAPDAAGNQQSMPKTMFAGSLHNDCAQLGMPPQYQVMVCERQSAMGGDSILLDLWQVLERIRLDDPSLLHDLFFVPRAYPSGHLTRYGLTWSLMRGNLVCQHPTRARSGRIGVAFQRFIDAAPTVRFNVRPGQVYVNNNHRCLHGRDAFNDPARRFVRLLYWFDRPLPAPENLMALAREGGAELERRLAGEEPPLRRLLGAGACRDVRGQGEHFVQMLQHLLAPTNCDDWQGSGQRELLLQEALLDAAWQLAGSPGAQPADPARLRALIQEGQPL